MNLDALILLLYLIAIVCFILATFGVTARVNLVALGLAAYVTTWLLRSP